MSTEQPLSHAQSPFLKEAFARGYLHQCTDVEGLDKAFAAGPVTAYIGYDCTADSLHVGHLMNCCGCGFVASCTFQRSRWHLGQYHAFLSCGSLGRIEER